MMNFVLILIVCAIVAKALEDESIMPENKTQEEGVIVPDDEIPEGEVIVPDNKTQCLGQMTQWCNSMQYPQQGAGLAVLSIVYEDPNGYYRVFCSSDSDGTNCTRNKAPWFTCTSDHVFTYKGQIMSNSTLAPDIYDDICTTADKAFNEIFVQNLSYENMTLQNEVQKSMEAFFDQMAVMEEQIEIIQRMLRYIPYIGDFWNLFGNGFISDGTDLISDVPEDSNQIPTTTQDGNLTVAVPEDGNKIIAVSEDGNKTISVPQNMNKTIFLPEDRNKTVADNEIETE